MLNCAIIGSGSIGSRHLQSLAHLKIPVRIELVDPDPQALKFSEELFFETYKQEPGSIEFILHKNIESLANCLDIVIITTNSKVRAQLIEKIVHKSLAKNLILEKVLFQKVHEYHSIHKTLSEKRIPTWVNCWMRTAGLFKKIKAALNPHHPVQMKIDGSRWGMGTSSIHYMDLFSYFTECNKFKFTDIWLDNKSTDSKREGFKEFSGQMAGENSRGDSLNLSCLQSGDKPNTIEIINGPDKYKVIRSIGNRKLNMEEVDFQSTNKFSKRMERATLPYQNQLTHVWINHILEKGSCDLPTYSESVGLHLELIRVFTDHLKKITGKEIDACPIT